MSQTATPVTVHANQLAGDLFADRRCADDPALARVTLDELRLLATRAQKAAVDEIERTITVNEPAEG